MYKSESTSHQSMLNTNQLRRPNFHSTKTIRASTGGVLNSHNNFKGERVIKPGQMRFKNYEKKARYSSDFGTKNTCSTHRIRDVTSQVVNKPFLSPQREITYRSPKSNSRVSFYKIRDQGTTNKNLTQNQRFLSPGKNAFLEGDKENGLRSNCYSQNNLSLNNGRKLNFFAESESETPLKFIGTSVGGTARNLVSPLRPKVNLQKNTTMDNVLREIKKINSGDDDESFTGSRISMFENSELATSRTSVRFSHRNENPSKTHVNSVVFPRKVSPNRSVFKKNGDAGVKKSKKIKI